MTSPSESSSPAWGPPELSASRDALHETTRWDLAVIGAGITGAGIARDAARRGLSVIVLEASDVAFGTSSRSSRLIHGGVRYLEQGEVGLVYEALRERSRLYATAPHLVRPARFLFPSYRGDRLGPWRLRLGLTLYDTLNFFRGQGHDYLAPAQACAVEPALSPEQLRGAVQYEDAITDDARLTLTVLQDARRHGAQVLTYCEVEGIEAGEAGNHRVRLRDGGAIEARQAIVATGPWTGSKLLGRPGQDLLSLSKGIHLVMRASDVPVNQPVVAQVAGQRRILFIVPWGSRTYLGTTDATYEGDPGRSGVTPEDEQELLEIIARLLPRAALRPDRIVSAWSGVRPLVRPPDTGGNTVEMSRRHQLIENDLGVLGLVGGKLTTFRAMAEDALDHVLARLRKQGAPLDAEPCSTHTHPLVPGEPLSAQELQDPLLEDLAPRHGPVARALAQRVAQTPAVGERLVEDLPYRWCEIDHAIAHEGCTHLDDVLRRRLPLALTDPALGGRVARRIAQTLVDAWGGTEADIQRELERYRELVHTETRRSPAA